MGGDVVKKCGVVRDKQQLVLVYESESGNLRKKVVPLRDFTQSSDVVDYSILLRAHKRYGSLFRQLPLAQLQKMLGLVHDSFSGLDIEQSLARQNDLSSVKPDEDLNKLGEEELARKKAAMASDFEKNLVKPGDEDFVYDIEQSFSDVGEDDDNGGIKGGDWEDSSEDEF